MVSATSRVRINWKRRIRRQISRRRERLHSGASLPSAFQSRQPSQSRPARRSTYSSEPLRRRQSQAAAQAANPATVRK